MFGGALTVDYGGGLFPPVLEKVAEGNPDLADGHRGTAEDADSALRRAVPFLRDPAVRASVVRVRRGA